MKLDASLGEVDFLVLDDSTGARASQLREQCEHHDDNDDTGDNDDLCLCQQVNINSGQCLYCPMKYFLSAFPDFG